MKNTNKLLSAIVAIAITMFASVEISAMNENNNFIPELDLSIMNKKRKINPKLNERNRQLLENNILFIENKIQIMQQFPRRGDVARVANLRNTLNRYLAMYYGKHPYTEKQIFAVDVMFQ